MLNIKIRVKGSIDEQWSEWFEGLTITHAEGGETQLSGALADQAALYGLLARLWSLRLPLVSVDCTEGSAEEPSADGPSGEME